MPYSTASSASDAVWYFKELLEDCDVHMETRYIISQAPSIIIRKIEKKLTEDANFPNNVETFLNGLNTLYKDENEFSKALNSTEYAETNCTEQESILRIFLNVSCLQNFVIELLLEHLTNFACESNVDTPRLPQILRVLRRLPFINEPAQFTTKVLDLIEIANTNMRRELLNHIPELVPDNQIDEAAKQLSELLEDCDDLAGSIIDCVNSFNISAVARFHIQEHIMKRLLSCTRYYKIFPVLFEFLMTDCKQENMVNVLLKTRTMMDYIMRAESSETISYKAVTFKKFEILAMDERFLFDGFVNMFATMRESVDHKPADVLVLFMLHSTCKGKKKIVEAIFKKRVKNSLFKVALLERVFEKYFVHQIFYDYFTSMLEISGLLLKCQDDASIKIGSVMYKLLFVNKFCSRAQRQDILHNLMSMIGMRDFKNASVALKVISGLLEKNAMQRHAVQLMGLLKKVDVLDLNDVKQLFEILCSITCGEGSEQLGLKDELYIYNSKQLLSLEKVNKQKGLISAVILAKHIALVKELHPLDQNVSIDSLESLPDGPAKEAASLLLKANKCARGLPEMLGLYYDQLSSMIVSASNLDPYFLLWLFETITKDFETIFIVDALPEPINDLKLTAQYALNTDSEVEDFRAVNVGEMTIKRNGTIITLAPLFKLLRLLHYKQNDGDLLSNDDFIGLPIIMPEYDSIDNLHIDQVKQVADCLFHCINWFRELISAFCTQSTKRLRAKVIKRLMQLTQLEETLQECMEIIPEHKLPSSCVDILPSQSTQTKREYRGITKSPKRFKSPVLPNETLPSTSASAVSNYIPRQKRRPIKTEFNFQFREMDTDIIVLLKYPLTISVSCSQTQSTTLHLKQFQFLLKDLILKLDILTTHKVSSLSDLNTVDPVNLITNCQRFIPMMQKQNRAIVHEIKNLLQTLDDRHDVAEIFTKEAEDLKGSYGLILEFYSVIFRWSGFQHITHQTLLQNCLKIVRTTDPSQSLMHTGKYIIDFINNICQSTEQCLLLSSAVRMIEIMQALYNIHSGPEVRKLITTISEKFLKRKWFNPKGKQESGKLAFVHIDVLVKAYLSDASAKTICGLVATLQNEVPNLKSRDDYLLMLGSIDKPNFHILYRGLCGALSDRVKSEVAALTNNEHLILWKIIALTMQGLMNIVKIQSSKGNFNCFLKKSITILKTFISRGVPIMEIMLRSKPDQVVEIFKIMQTSTRFLHHLCCYSKNVKDSILMSQVPQFRRILETLVCQVKAALIANNCSEAFWMGNLKNIDLQGDEILSQSTVTDSIIEEDELPLEESDDEDLVVNVNSDKQSMSSDLFDVAEF